MAADQRVEARNGTPLSARIRPRLVEGQYLDAETIARETHYRLETQRLLSRVAHGGSILYGLELEAGPTDGSIVLSPGAALDPTGQLIVVPEPLAIDPARHSNELVPREDPATGGPVTVALEFRAREVEAGTAVEETCAVVLLPGAPESAIGESMVDELFGGTPPPWGGTPTPLPGPAPILTSTPTPVPTTCPDLGGTPTPTVPDRPTGSRAMGKPHARALPAALNRILESSAYKANHVVVGWVEPEELGPTARRWVIHDDGRRPAVDGPRLFELLRALWPHVQAPPPRAANRGNGIGGPPNGHSAELTGRPTAAAMHSGGRSASVARAEPAEPLHVVAVEFVDNSGNPLGALDSGLRPFRHTSAAGPGVSAIYVTFNRPIAAASCTTVDPYRASVLVRSDWSVYPRGQVPGSVSVQGRTLRYQVDETLGEFPRGDYEVTLYGEDDPATQRPAITASDGVRLDGEPRGLPSGDGAEGGNFVFRLRITDV